ncbi:TPA: DNA helicase RecG, partial [Patescibacteria group bacterium]|nr:DNA helicase RecG [Patescibacteria group bacterium]
QHYLSVAPLLKEFGVNCALRTQAYQEGSDTANAFIGTHALIQSTVKFKNLNLVIIDEQHRFGVKQREALKTKGHTPHFISLTATPIPRSLALTAFGDLDISVIPHKPLNRKPILTQALEPDQRQLAYKRMMSELESGHQVFVITPLIETSAKLSAKSAEAEYKNIQKLFPHFTVGLLHGRLTSEQKTNVMADFKAGKLQILVATTVIEVGIDIPNATVMLIEGAERFGLSQLHQLRGRVGRSDLQSYCFIAPSEANPEIMERLGMFSKTDDGFKLAELDLQLRGPGALFGHSQSGFLRYRLADWTDTRAIKQAQDAANAILDEDATLEKYPELARRIDLETITAHSE